MEYFEHQSNKLDIIHEIKYTHIKLIEWFTDEGLAFMMICYFPVIIRNINYHLFLIEPIFSKRCNYLRFTFHENIDKFNKLCFLKGLERNIKVNNEYEYTINIITRLNLGEITNIINLVYGIQIVYKDSAAVYIKHMLLR